MKKLMIAAVGGTLAGLLMTAQLTGPLIAQEADRTKSTYEQLDLFGDIFERIRATYVEPVDEQKLIRAAISGMVKSLDPHSSYLPPEDFEAMQVQTRGQFGGLGIEVTQENGFVKVVSPIDDTPAARAGVESGDFITKVDGESTLGMSLDDAVKLMRGEIGEEIVITIVREGTEEPFDVTLKRDVIKVKATRGRVEGKSVVLRITSFSDQTYVNLESEMKKRITEAGGMENVNGFIIDLRNNPGGLLNQAILVADAFLESGEIVSTRGRNSQDNDRVNATPGDLAQGKPMVVLINGGSASASEIVAGALKDHHRAIVVGTQSFGKGSVQTIMPLQGDGALRLTTARYYTPSGRSIQNLGVAPDILVEFRRPKPDGEEEDVVKSQRFEADLNGAITNDSLTDDEKKQLKEERKAQEEAAKLRSRDSQLSYALDMLTGLAVLQGAN